MPRRSAPRPPVISATGVLLALVALVLGVGTGLSTSAGVEATSVVEATTTVTSCAAPACDGSTQTASAETGEDQPDGVDVDAGTGDVARELAGSSPVPDDHDGGWPSVRPRAPLTVPD